MKRFFFAMVLVLSSLPLRAEPPAGSSWKSVEKILGCQGREQAGGFQVDFPREDLNVTVHGLPLEPELAFTSRFYFKPLEKGTFLAGEIVLLDQEVHPVTAQLIRNGFQVSQAQGFLLNESPSIKMLHIKGVGSRINLAMALKRVLSAAPLEEESSEKLRKPTAIPTQPLFSSTPSIGQIPRPPAPDEWAGVKAVLGPGKVEGKVLQYEYPFGKNVSDHGVEISSWMGMETILRFQMVQGVLRGEKNFWDFGISGQRPKKLVAAAGQFLLTPEQASAVQKSLAGSRVKMAAQRDLDTSPRVVFVYFWAMGPCEELTEDLKGILDQIHLAGK